MTPAETTPLSAEELDALSTSIPRMQECLRRWTSFLPW